MAFKARAPPDRYRWETLSEPVDGDGVGRCGIVQDDGVTVVAVAAAVVVTVVAVVSPVDVAVVAPGVVAVVALGACTPPSMPALSSSARSALGGTPRAMSEGRKAIVITSPSSGR